MDRWIDLAVLLASMAREFVPLVIEALKGRKPTIEKGEGRVRIYRIPIFNLVANVWLPGNLPASDAPDLEEVPCQLYMNPRHEAQGQETPAREYLPGIWIRYPIDRLNEGETHIWEAPSGSGRYYRVRHTHIQHEGFPNAYLAALVHQADENGDQVYFPGGASTPGGDPVAGGEGEMPDTEFIPSGAAGEGIGSYTYAFLLEEWTV